MEAKQEGISWFFFLNKTHSRKAKWNNLCISKTHRNYTYLILQNIMWCFFLYKENYTDHKLHSTIPILQSLTTLKWGCAAIINITLLRLCYYVLRRGRVGQSCGCSAWWPLWCGRAGWHCSEPPRHTLLRSATKREKKHTGCIITKSKTQWETGRLTHKHSQRRPSRHGTHTHTIHFWRWSGSELDNEYGDCSSLHLLSRVNAMCQLVLYVLSAEKFIWYIESWQ